MTPTAIHNSDMRAPRSQKIRVFEIPSGSSSKSEDKS